MKKRKQGCELPLAFYQKWKVNDNVISYASLGKPRIEPRLQEIYRKFATKLTEYEDELKDNFNIKGDFKPKEVREEIIKRKQNQDTMDKLREQVESEIERVYANKEKKETQHNFVNQKKKVQTVKEDVKWSESLRQAPKVPTKTDKGQNLNEDLMGLDTDTLEPPDQGMPPQN